ncbi:MAG TPA: hypothetical protein VGP61_03860 [Gemmatimonadales bacterium]|nr:hypothetical protein [Gemmatimonadales bacterium]
MTGDTGAFRASAPVRLDFAGGWTDVAPFAMEEGGMVVNAAIELRAYAEVRPGGDRQLIHSEELGKQVELREGTWTPELAGELELQKAALRQAQLGPCVLRTRSDAPPGSGLGSSGALGVALLAACDAAGERQRTPPELAEAAFQLEAVEAGLPGGKQDQYAAALGGFHRFRFGPGAVEVEALQLDAGFAASLADHLVLCYTGTSRVSSNTISRVMGAYAARVPAVVSALRSLAQIAERMVEALRAGDLLKVARLLSGNWRFQQQLDPGMRTEAMARLEAALTAGGALGGKAAGAGAGGSMFFVVKDPEVARHAAEQAGARVLRVRWAPEGVRRENA